MGAAKKTSSTPGVHELARSIFKAELFKAGWTVTDTGEVFADRGCEDARLSFTLDAPTFLPSKVSVTLRCERQGMRTLSSILGETGPRKPRYGIHSEADEKAYRDDWVKVGVELAEAVKRRMQGMIDDTAKEREREERQRAATAARAQQLNEEGAQLEKQLATIGFRRPDKIVADMQLDRFEAVLPGDVRLKVEMRIGSITDGGRYDVTTQSYGRSRQQVVDLMRFLADAKAIDPEA